MLARKIINNPEIIGTHTDKEIHGNEDKIKDKDIAEALELPPIKLHCSVLAEDSIRKAIQNWKEKNENNIRQTT